MNSHRVVGSIKAVLGVLLVALPGAVMGQASEQASERAEVRAPGYEEARKQLWALEQSIYVARAAGSMAVVNGSLSPHRAAWPSISQEPNSRAVRKPLTALNGPGSLRGNQEKVDLHFLDMAFDGHTAVMMYKTHKTRMSDGSPADDYFEVLHIWSREDGSWRLLTNRPQPVSPPK